jgi:hypothetical protein
MSDAPTHVRDYFDEMLYGKEEILARKRRAELEHERELAEIRTRSKALVWTGAAEQLTAIVRAWYESGLMQAENLQDALEKASTHFVNPSGANIVTLSFTKSIPEPTIRKDAATFSDSYQRVRFRAQDYDLTGHRYAPRILKVLHESLRKGEPGLTTSQIRKKAGLPHNGKMYDWFRGTGLWKKLVITVGRDMYRLDSPA